MDKLLLVLTIVTDFASIVLLFVSLVLGGVFMYEGNFLAAIIAMGGTVLGLKILNTKP